jgi:hypothetical protein
MCCIGVNGIGPICFLVDSWYDLDVQYDILLPSNRLVLLV